MGKGLHGEAMRFAVCIRNDDYPVSLDIGNVYAIIPDQEGEAHGMVRIVDETADDYLYPTAYFRLVDSRSDVVEADAPRPCR
ncbi:hypothetical protein FHS01_001599 [Longimicrobium terrae]|uniref:Uncharacterized protein n=1 Tax=Longimicrobium terrae TaxID=1639882 RepID=A0A841GMH0_9BACT|nr:hypothetical protein [Longimicrobium terrae]MBB6069981.1 hypothetical protein [Longimicrobium terrae]